MKTKNIYQGLALLAMALTTAACQNELNEDATTQPQPGEKVEMIIRATQGTAPQTRTGYEDQLGVEGIDAIVVKWEGGKEAGAPTEQIRVFGYDANELNYFVDFSSNPGSISDDGKSISFGGEIEQKAHYLAMYPADKCIYDENDAVVYTSFLGQTQDCATPMKHLKDFDFMVGSRKDEDKNNNFEFTHQATMIRFILALPSNEIITKVSLSSTVALYSRMYTTVDATGATVEVDKDPEFATPIPSFDLDITGHTASSTPLKAYMMMPPIDLSNATLTITVKTKSGSTYEGSINAAASQDLKAGLCYTLSPTLTVTSEINIPTLEEGNLTEALKDFTPDASQTELTLTGKVNTDDVKALTDFLKAENQGGNITTLDLSGLTIPSTGTDSDGAPIIPVTGFTGCTTLTDVKLPAEATAIADDAFAGCTALKNVSQDEPATNTRASISSRLKTVGARAFKGTAIDVMFLHKNITSIGDNAFEGCTALTALVFEGTNKVGTGLTLGTNILTGCTQEGLNILLPAITDVTVATTYKKALGKSTYFEYNGTYSTATNGDKVNSEKYNASVPDGSGVGNIEPGGNWGK